MNRLPRYSPWWIGPSPGCRERRTFALLCASDCTHNLPQAIEVRVGPQGVKAKWVRIELRKIETLPGGGVANTFFDFVGQSPINLWQSPNDEYNTLHTVRPITDCVHNSSSHSLLRRTTSRSLFGFRSRYHPQSHSRKEVSHRLGVYHDQRPVSWCLVAIATPSLVHASTITPTPPTATSVAEGPS